MLLVRRAARTLRRRREAIVDIIARYSLVEDVDIWQYIQQAGRDRRGCLQVCHFAKLEGEVVENESVEEVHHENDQEIEEPGKSRLSKRGGIRTEKETYPSRYRIFSR